MGTSICTNATALTRRGLTSYSARNAAEFALDGRGRGVLENASAEEERLNPDRVQHEFLAEIKSGNRGTNQRRTRRMIVVARSNHRNRANMIRSICVPMNALVQSWRSAQRQSPKKSYAKESSDNGAVAPAASHWRRPSVRSTSRATSFCAVTSELEPRISYPTDGRCR